MSEPILTVNASPKSLPNPSSQEALSDTALSRVSQLLRDSTPENQLSNVTDELFCELCQLQGDGDSMEWKQTGRWVKFEESVIAAGDRWGKPSVATLNLHSIYELRECLTKGVIMLEAEALNLSSLIDQVLSKMVQKQKLPANLKDLTQQVLLRPHRHQYQRVKRNESDRSTEPSRLSSIPVIRSLADIGRSTSKHRKMNAVPTSPTLGKSDTAMEIRRQQQGAATGDDVDEPLLVRPNADGDRTDTMSPSPSEIELQKFNKAFMRKIPSGAEACNILVGQADFLQQPVTAFIRMKNAVMFGNITEVAIPTRFLFFLLGPKEPSLVKNYHNIGRALGTLMSDEVFHSVAYRARNQEHLMVGLDEFMNQVTILPPGEWDPAIRIEPPESVPDQTARLNADDTDGQHGHGGHEAAARDLQRTGRLFGGLVADIKRRAPFYWSEFKDALSLQSLAVVIFLFLTTLANTVTFGGLLGIATKGYMAAFECILSAFVNGIIWHLFSGQPLNILSATGPMLVFEKIVYDLSVQLGLDFMSFRGISSGGGGSAARRQTGSQDNAARCKSDWREAAIHYRMGIAAVKDASTQSR